MLPHQKHQLAKQWTDKTTKSKKTRSVMLPRAEPTVRAASSVTRNKTRDSESVATRGERDLQDIDKMIESTEVEKNRFQVPKAPAKVTKQWKAIARRKKATAMAKLKHHYHGIKWTSGVHWTTRARQTLDKKMTLDAEPTSWRWRCRNRGKESSSVNS